MTSKLPKEHVQIENNEINLRVRFSPVEPPVIYVEYIEENELLYVHIPPNKESVDKLIALLQEAKGKIFDS